MHAIRLLRPLSSSLCAVIMPPACLTCAAAALTIPCLHSTKGVLKAVYDIPLNSTHKIMSPDHPSVSLPNPNGALPASVNLPRSRGFEGMAQSPDGRYLYPLLEGPVYDQGAKKYEMVGDREYLRLFKFNVASRAFEGEPMKYVLEQNGELWQWQCRQKR